MDTGYQEYVFIIDIGSVATDDIANGKLANWDTAKELELGVRTWDATYNAKLFAVQTKNNVVDYSGIFTPPRLVIEAIGTTYHSAVPRIVTKKSGQLLETIAGVCDGRSITVASGTYTLENITTGTKIDESSPNFIDFPGSSITYKPPPGTRQVYYSFHLELFQHI